MKITFEDGSTENFDAGTTALDALKAFDKKALKKAAAARVGGELVDLTAELKGDATVEAVPLETKDGLDVYRHTTAHVMAEAVMALFPDAQMTIGPTIEDGFYYDFDSDHGFTPEDVTAIEKKMTELIKANTPIKREEVTKREALLEFSGNVYKKELIDDIDGGGGGEGVSIYRQGDFKDLCRGPHLPSTGYIKAFKLTATAGAYWRGDENNKMLQRIYGTAFADKKELKAHLDRIEEAKKRDHRKLGKELDLFSISDEIGAGLVLWHPKGSVIRNIIEDFWKKEHARGGYSIIHTPHVAKLDLWKKSGHWDFYRENLYSPMDVDGTDYIVKPMNCPFHINIFKGALRSYRELPIRYAELGTVYRYERSGVLHGLLRVRGFTQDDAHIYMRPDQLEEEIRGVLKFTLYILRSFGFNDYQIYLSTRPEKYVGTVESWADAEAALKGALESEGLAFEVDPGEGVFDGPKIDIKIKDVLGRSWQCSTLQVDFNLPERFDIGYRDASGNTTRPIMLHRALMGSLERFFGCLIEHYGGAFPVWLAPVQVMVLSVTERSEDYAEEVALRLRAAGLRVECDKRNEKLGYKIREGRLQKVPYMLIAGDKEVESRLVSPRSREAGEMDAMTVDDFIELVKKDDKPLGGDSQ